MIVEQQWRQGLAHVPFEIIRQHAQQDMRPHPWRGPVKHRPQVQIDRLDAAERTLDLGQGFVGPHGARSIGQFNRQAGAQHIETVEPGLFGDGPGLAREAEDSRR